MNNYQITLFFDQNTIYKSIELSNALLDNIDILGDPILLPNNSSIPKEANFPIIIFNKNNNIQITANYQNIIITIKKDESIEIENLITSINNALMKNEIKVIRIGYGYKTQLDKELIEKFKKKIFLEEELKRSINFEISWLNEIDINMLKVNCWQRYYTEQSAEYLNVIFDINTKAEEKYTMDNEFLKKFVNESEIFIKEKIYK